MTILKKTLEEFFWARVQKNDGCWLWTGNLDGPGYGIINRHRTAKRIGAHRVSWEIHNKTKIPKGMFVCHKCDNPPCVRPEHLFLGTQSDNLRDASKKGRMSVPGKGWERNKTHCSHGHKFSEENTYRWKNKRVCRQCHTRLEQERRDRQKVTSCR